MIACVDDNSNAAARAISYLTPRSTSEGARARFARIRLVVVVVVCD